MKQVLFASRVFDLARPPTVPPHSGTSVCCCEEALSDGNKSSLFSSWFCGWFGSFVLSAGSSVTVPAAQCQQWVTEVLEVAPFYEHVCVD